MMHVAYPTEYPLRPGVQVSILVTPIRVGDALAIEYPDNNRGAARVLSAEANRLEIVVGRKRWRLAPLEPTESAVAPIRFAREPVPIWVVQPSKIEATN
jgi:hypothetical protein